MTRKSTYKQKMTGNEAADRLLIPVIILLGLAIFGCIWEFSPLREYADPEKAAALARQFSSHPAAPIIMVGIFVISQLALFPLIIMTLTTAMVFGPVEGVFISLAGACISASITYLVGRRMGTYGLQKMMGPVCARIRLYIQGTGIAGMIALRFVPVAPYSVVNIALGVLSIPFWTYISGSFLALLPGCIIRSFLGGAITDLWEKPDAHNLGIVGVGIALWLLIVVAAHALVSRWRKRHGLSQSRPIHKKWRSSTHKG